MTIALATSHGRSPCAPRNGFPIGLCPLFAPTASSKLGSSRRRRRWTASVACVFQRRMCPTSRIRFAAPRSGCLIELPMGAIARRRISRRCARISIWKLLGRAAVRSASCAATGSDSPANHRTGQINCRHAAAAARHALADKPRPLRARSTGMPLPPATAASTAGARGSRCA